MKSKLISSKKRLPVILVLGDSAYTTRSSSTFLTAMCKQENWFSGPPPSEGWWPTRAYYGQAVKDASYGLRWFMDNEWSVPVTESEYELAPVTPELLNAWAATPSAFEFADIYWQPRPDSWPEHSRT